MRLTLFLFLGFVLSGCTSPQHIRKDNYYRYDWGVSGTVTGQTSEAIQHHPIFAHIEETSLEGAPNLKKDLHYFLFGVLPRDQEVTMSEACGQQPFRQAYVDHSFLQATVSVLTIGIYTPRTVQIWCGNEKTNR